MLGFITNDHDVIFIGPCPTVLSPSKLAMVDFIFVACIGRGHFGKVLLAEFKFTQELVAIKCLKKKEVLARDELDTLAVEKKVFQTVTATQHPFLVNMHATFQTEVSSTIVVTRQGGRRRRRRIV